MHAIVLGTVISLNGGSARCPISLREAVKLVVLCALILSGVAALDTLIGFTVGRQHTLLDAFINSGPFGGIVDAFLFLCGALFGVPALVRAVWM